MRYARSLAAAATLAAAAPDAAPAQPVRDVAGFRAATLQANDDGSTGAVSLDPLSATGLDFFGTRFTHLFVNTNGNVTFAAPLPTFTPFGLTTNIGTPIIAPFFADVDTRGPSLGGSLDGEGNHGNVPQPFDGSGLVTYGVGAVDGRAALGVNWFSDCDAWTGAGAAPASCRGRVGVGYFDGEVAHLDVFQLVLVERGDVAAGDFDIEFNYGTVGWNTGEASGGDADGRGGIAARVGFSNGTGAAGSFFELPGSGVDGAFLDGGPAGTALVRNSNVGVAGRYRFEVRGGVVSVPTPATVPEPATLALTGGGLALLVSAGGVRRGAARSRRGGSATGRAPRAP